MVSLLTNSSVKSLSLTRTAVPMRSLQAQRAGISQPRFSGEAKDKFLNAKLDSELGNVIDAPAAQRLARDSADQDLKTHYVTLLFMKHRELQQAAQQWRSMLLYGQEAASPLNPKRLTYMDLLKMIQEEGEEYPERFSREAKAVFDTASKKERKQFKDFQMGTNQKGVARVKYLEENMGEVGKAYLSENLKRLEEAGLVEPKWILAPEFGHDHRWGMFGSNKEVKGFKLTALGKVIVATEVGGASYQQTLVDLTIPQLAEQEQLRKHLLKIKLPKGLPASSNPFAQSS